MNPENTWTHHADYKQFVLISVPHPCSLFQFIYLSLVDGDLPCLGVAANPLWGFPQSAASIHAYAICCYLLEMLSNLNEQMVPTCEITQTILKLIYLITVILFFSMALFKGNINSRVLTTSFIFSMQIPAAIDWEADSPSHLWTN